MTNAWFRELITLFKAYHKATQDYRRAIKKLSVKTGLSEAEARRRVASQFAHWGR